MALNIGAKVVLNNGVEMPLLGLGTWALTGPTGLRAVAWALESGYRLIDTAAAYNNEEVVGEAIRTSGISRDEVFVTTKLRPSASGREEALGAFEASRRRLGLERVDLYLIHWPADDRLSRDEGWSALEVLLADGRCRAIGVSNYGVRELEEILASGRTTPAVNQVEYNPFSQPRAVHAFCRDKGIRVEGYSPLTLGRRLDDRVIQAVARDAGRTPAQILIRWAIQKEIITIPKSGRRERILENAGVFDFELSPEEMAGLDGLNEATGRRR
jgi:diketogulonate reductase-like aldo/keto reductase